MTAGKMNIRMVLAWFNRSQIASNLSRVVDLTTALLLKLRYPRKSDVIERYIRKNNRIQYEIYFVAAAVHPAHRQFL